LIRASAAVLAFTAAGALAQNCPAVNPEAQKAKEAECHAAGGAWARYGVHDHLCNVYSCAERTRDAGKPCRNRAECEHLCVTERAPTIGAETEGRCTAVKTSFGCYTHVDGGRIVGRVCVD
jgi:hypothetical protein